MKKLIFILTTIILLTGCTPVLKTLYGIKNPKLTTTEKTKGFLNKKNIEGKDIYFKNAKYFAKAANASFQIPGAVFYNKNGQEVVFKNTAKECTNDITLFIENISTINTLPTKEGLNLNELLQYVVDSNGNSITVDKDADAIVFINWSTYMGKLNKTVFEWTDIIQKMPKNSNVKVDYYLLSFDLLDKWEDKQLLEGKK